MDFKEFIENFVDQFDDIELTDVASESEMSNLNICSFSL